MKTNRTQRTIAPNGRIFAVNRLVKITLDYRQPCMGDESYRISRIVNEIAVCVGKESRHVGDYLTEKEANDLLTEPGYEVTVVPRS